MKISQIAFAALLGATLLAPVAIAAPDAKAPAPAEAKPTIVLVHGAWANGSSWSKVIPLLKAKGYSVVAVHEPLSSLAEDAAAVTRAINAAPGEVVLVGHSWGGFVITEAGNNPKVKALVYVAAFGPDANESITDMGKGQPPAAWQTSIVVDSGKFAWLTEKLVKENFAQDLTAAEQALITATQAPLSLSAFDAKVKVPAWKSKPSWYVRAENDKIIDPKAEELMAKRMGATFTSIKASHVAMLAKPADVTKAILAAATAPAKTAAAAPAAPVKK